MKRSIVRRSRRPRAEGEVGLPYAEPSPPEETYADAAKAAQDYPVVQMPHRAVANRLNSETRWQEVCEGISTHGGLERPYLE